MFPEQPVVLFNPPRPGRARNARAPGPAFLDNFHQHPAQVGGVSGLEFDVGIVRHPAHRRRDHGTAACERLQHTHGSTLVEGGNEDVVQRVVELGHFAFGKQEGGAGPAGAREMPLQFGNVHDLLDQGLALAAGVVGAAHDAYFDLRTIRVEIDARRDGDDVFDRVFAQQLLVAPRHANAEIDLAGRTEKCVARAFVPLFQVGEKRYLEGRYPLLDAARAVGHVVLNVGRGIRSSVVRHVVQGIRKFSSQAFQDPVSIRYHNVNSGHAASSSLPAPGPATARALPRAIQTPDHHPFSSRFPSRRLQCPGRGRPC